MKKKLAGLLAALMVLSMSTTVFAITSPTAEDISKAESAAEVSTDSGVTLSKSQIATTDYKEAAQKAENITAEAEVLAAFELTAPSGATFPLTVTIAVSGIKKGDTVKVLHKCSQHGWETLTPSNVSDGSVTVSVDSLSPIAVVRTATAAQNGSNGNTNTNETQPIVNNYYNYYTNPAASTGNTSATNGSTSSDANNSGITQTNNNNQVVNVTTTAPAAATPGASTSNTSPKTETNVPVLPIIAVLSILGIAVCSKKALSL